MTQITPEAAALIDRALAEDLALGDPTTEVLISPDLDGRAGVVAREPGVLAGGSVLEAVFRRLDPSVGVTIRLPDGSHLGRGEIIAEVEGPLAPILMAERTALNFIQRLSGIATATSMYVDAVKGFGVRIVDTRKTTPGLRALEKQAVRAGGGFNHRRALADGILIKDNHVEALRRIGLSLSEIIRNARAGASHTIRIEVEVEDADEAREALEAGADILLLDNMRLGEMSRVVQMACGRAVIEASGGITLKTVRDVAATGVDLVSVGALTHSAIALDIGLDIL